MALGAKNKHLWSRLCVELGAAPITEAYLSSEYEYVYGLCDKGSITIAPHNHIVDTVIHELLHRIYEEEIMDLPVYYKTAKDQLRQMALEGKSAADAYEWLYGVAPTDTDPQ